MHETIHSLSYPFLKQKPFASQVLSRTDVLNFALNLRQTLRVVVCRLLSPSFLSIVSLTEAMGFSRRWSRLDLVLLGLDV